MRALQLIEAGPARHAPLRLVELPDPTPGAGELLLRVGACAVCRTDLQLVEGDLAARRLPIVPGHQAAGEVVDVGPGVDDWGIGDRAGVTWLASTDGTCRFCRSGRENLCDQAQFTGWDRDGGFAEAMLVRADHAVRIPEGPRLREIAPLLCGGVIGFRALRISGIEPGGRLGLFGFGASALLSIQVARHWGCEVHVRTRSVRGRERALELGASSVGDYEEPVPHPLDAAVTMAPSGDVVIAALRAVDRGGIVAINAIHLDRIPEFSYDLLWQERQLRSVANVTRRDAADFIELAGTIPIRTETECFALEDGNEALARIGSGTIHGTAVLVMPERPRSTKAIAT